MDNGGVVLSRSLRQEYVAPVSISILVEILFMCRVRVRFSAEYWDTVGAAGFSWAPSLFISIVVGSAASGWEAIHHEFLLYSVLLSSGLSSQGRFIRARVVVSAVSSLVGSHRANQAGLVSPGLVLFFFQLREVCLRFGACRGLSWLGWVFQCVLVLSPFPVST